jgi:hypothetical protein
MMSHLCNRCVHEFLILARTWFAFGLPSKTGCDSPGVELLVVVVAVVVVAAVPVVLISYRISCRSCRIS